MRVSIQSFFVQVGEYSEIYDNCVKVSEKREIARLVVSAVYENGGRFLDAQGNDIGFKRSMDKAMKALKDRRHVRTRKLTARVNNPHKEPKVDGPPKIRETALSPKPVSPQRKATPSPHKKNPISTEDGIHALLLLRNAMGEASDKNDPHHEAEEEQQDVLPRKESLQSLPPHTDQETLLARIAEFKGRDTATGEATSEIPLTPEGTPVLWKSVIVSRERPQASLADMLVDAKQRLDALSVIQQTVAAPICLIYPPLPGTLPKQIPLQGQVQIGQSVFQGHPGVGLI